MVRRETACENARDMTKRSRQGVLGPISRIFEGVTYDSARAPHTARSLAVAETLQSCPAGFRRRAWHGPMCMPPHSGRPIAAPTTAGYSICLTSSQLRAIGMKVASAKPGRRHTVPRYTKATCKRLTICWPKDRWFTGSFTRRQSASTDELGTGS